MGPSTRGWGASRVGQDRSPDARHLPSREAVFLPLVSGFGLILLEREPEKEADSPDNEQLNGGLSAKLWSPDSQASALSPGPQG